MTLDNETFGQAIAVIGMSGRFPGARSLQEYWQVIQQGKDTITRGEILHPAAETKCDSPHPAEYIAARGVLADVESFDPGFFGFTPNEAAQLDPQQRTWLELAYHALESAGYAHDKHNQIISVFAGSYISSYLYGNLLPTRQAVEEFLRMRHVHSLALMVQNDPAFLPSRTAYKLGLRGPAVNVQTACSTSLVAIAMGVQSLLSLESDIVIAGGVCVALPQNCGYCRREGSIMSQDGTCRPYDNRSSGTVFGNGGGAVVLRRLADAEHDGDPILAVLRSAAINNDGHNKVSYLAPSPIGQAEVITTALGLAEVDAETIGYVEGHGTGTLMGDPIEVEGLTKAFRQHTSKNGYCCLGSAKGNIGHLDAAAGVAGFIRAVLALRNRVLPPTAHFCSPNPAIDFAKTPFYVLSEAKPWETTGHPRRAGVSSFGIGGTNAHVILEEYSQPTSSRPQREMPVTLRLSAKGAPALDRATADLLAYVETKTTEGSLDLQRVEATLRQRRRAHPLRRTIYVASATDALTALKLRGRWDTGQALDGRAKLFFAFPGQGSLDREALSALVAGQASFRKNLESVSQVALPLVGFDVEELCRTANQCPGLEADNTKVQVILFCVSVALARSLDEAGIKAEAFFGHSLGEWAAAHLSGQLPLQDAIRGVFHRGRLMSQTGPGAALSVHLRAADLQALLPAGATLASVNGPSRCLVSGRPEAIAELSSLLQARGTTFRSIPITLAVHSPVMDGIVEPFSEALTQLTWTAPSAPMLSSVTGTWFQSDPAANRRYFSEQLRAQVRFDLLLQTLAKQPASLVLEVGLGNTLCALTSSVLKDRSRFAAIPLVASGKSPEESAFPLERIAGKLWAHGLDVGSPALSPRAALGDLPPYPFERTRCWVDAPAANAETEAAESVVASGPVDAPGSTADRVAAIVAELSGLPESSLDRERLLTEFGLESLFLAELAEQLAKETDILIDHAYLTYHGSIAELAQYIDKRAGRVRSTPATADAGARPAVPARDQTAAPPAGPAEGPFRGLIKLREGDGRLPLFLIHGDRANELLPRLLPPEQTLYGYAHQGANGEPIRLKSIEALAARCLEEWTAVNGNAPCILAGHSYGATVAYHVAYLLRSRGVVVPHLYLLDGGHPRIIRSWYRFGPKWPVRFARNAIERLQDIKMIQRAEAYHLRSERVPPEVRTDYTIATYNLGLFRYFPPAIDVETTLFRASRNFSGLSHNGWNPAHFTSLRLIHVEGDHLDMVRSEDSFKTVAEVLLSDLERLRAQKT